LTQLSHGDPLLVLGALGTADKVREFALDGGALGAGFIQAFLSGASALDSIAHLAPQGAFLRVWRHLRLVGKALIIPDSCFPIAVARWGRRIGDTHGLRWRMGAVRKLRPPVGI
jgi:hypothetical protein